MVPFSDDRIVSDSHQHSRHSRAERQIAFNHRRKLAVRQVRLCFREQPAALEVAVDAALPCPVDILDVLRAGFADDEAQLRRHGSDLPYADASRPLAGLRRRLAEAATAAVPRSASPSAWPRSQSALSVLGCGNGLRVSLKPCNPWFDPGRINGRYGLRK